MPLNYDLHCHSTASDGELAPAALVRYANTRGVQALALTDHDTTAGLAEAQTAAMALGMTLINGVEISVSWNERLIHIVGLGFDPSAPELLRGLVDLRRQREARGEEIGRRLAGLGIADALSGARGHANGQILSRSHFARYLVEAGHVKSVQDAFKRFLGEGRPAYVASRWVGLAEAVGWITGAGGHAVIAHPARYRLSAIRLRALIDEFKACGGVAIEVVCGSHDRNQTHNMADYAVRYGLLASVGSDYHGPGQPWMAMGKLPPLPKRCTPVWTLWDEAAAGVRAVN